MKSQNLDIHFFKFLYSCMIVIYHLAGSTAITCVGGYCGVEYFLLSAGLFLFLSFEKGEKRGLNLTPGQYLKKRFARFFPWCITGYLLVLVVQRVLIDKTASLGQWADYFAKDIWEVLMINMNGMNNNEYLLNSPAWTLSAMLIVGFFIWALMYYYKNLFIRIIMPLTLVIGFGVWTHLPSANTERWMGFTNFGTFRTYLVFCLGYYCLQLAKKLAEIPFTKAGKCVLTIAEIIIHIFSLTIMFLRAERYYQWLITALFMVAIAIAMSGHSHLAQVLSKFKFIQFLGNLSMSIYLVHVAVTIAFRHVFDISAWGYIELIPVFAAVLLVSILHYYGTDWLWKLVTKAGEKTKKHLVKEF